MKESLRVYILDDEADAVSMLKAMLYGDDRVEIVGHNTDPQGAIIAIKNIKPDVLFLDINMPVISGIDILKVRWQLANNMDVVLFTAHQEYAVETIKYNPFDLLLKPVSPHLLNELVDRLIASRATEKNKKQLFINKLVIHNKGEAVLIDHQDIVCLTAEGNYTHILTKELKEHTVSKHLAYVQEKINQDYFYRINRSQIVNINYLQEVDFKNKSLVLRWNEYSDKYKISRANIKEIKNLLIE